MSIPTVHLELKFTYAAYSRVYDSFEYHQITIQPDNSLFVEVDYPEDEWLYTILLGFGAQVNVLSPLHIREIIINRAKEIVASADTHHF